MAGNTLNDTRGTMKIPAPHVAQLFRITGIQKGPLFSFFSIDARASRKDAGDASLWWESRSAGEKELAKKILSSMGNPRAITRMISVKFYDQANLVDIFSGDGHPETIYSVSLSPGGLDLVFDDQNTRIDFINAAMGFLETGDLPRDLANGAITLENDAFILLGCIVDFLQHSKYSEAIGDLDPRSSMQWPEIRKFIPRILRSGDLRWLTPLILRVFPCDPEPYRDHDWSGALGSLERMGFLNFSPVEGVVELSPEGMDFCCSFARSVKRLGVISLLRVEGQKDVLKNCLFVRTWNRVWVISPGAGDGLMPLVVMEPLSLSRLLDELIVPGSDSEPAGVPMPGPGAAFPPRVPPPEESFHVAFSCPSCHTLLPQNAKFCRRCGRPVQSPRKEP